MKKYDRNNKSKAIGLPSSKKSDSYLAKRQKEIEKQKLDQDATANIYNEFIAEFEESDSKSSVNKKKSEAKETSMYSNAPPASINCKKDKTKACKKKSNLELFKEELECQHKQRELRENVLRGISTVDGTEIFANLTNSETADMGEFDPQTTSLYIGNLNPNVMEKELIDIFLPFGPIAHIKMIRALKENEKKAGCAFITYMCRFDAETAIIHVKEHLSSLNLYLGWAKTTTFPCQPIYLSNNYVSNTPTYTGLPFCAVPENVEIFKGDLSHTRVIVQFPNDWAKLRLIHRFIEFVINDGPLFEAYVMNRELNNPSYRFLFDPYIPEHAYYRWRLFSLLQGDSMYNWSVKEFVMFKGGSVWVPPPLPPGYTSKTSFKISKDNKILEKSLSQKQLSTLRNLLRHLTADRKKVAEIMVWALDHNECAKEIIDNFQQSLTIKTTALNIKIARLYALSDILYNSSIDRSGAGDFRRLIEKYLLNIFEHFHTILSECNSRITAEKIKKCITPCFNAWQKWFIFAPSFIQQLNNTFLGSKQCTYPIEDEDIDGVPLSNTELTSIETKISTKRSNIEQIISDEDIDGEPLNPTELQMILDNRAKY